MKLLPLLAAGASARVLDSLSSVPKGWKELRIAEPHETVSLKIALRQQRSDALERTMLDISTPGHAKYGAHMTRDELRSYTAPSGAAVDGVTAWVGQYGIAHRVNNDWISLSTNTRIANELLNTTFGWYEYEGGGGPKLRALSYSVPDEIADHVDLVQPTTRFGQLGAQKSAIFNMSVVDDAASHAAKGKANLGPGADECGTPVTPDCLRSLYNIKYTAKPSGNLVAFASYLEQYARYTDLAQFESTYAPEAKGQNFSVTLVNKGKDDQTSAEDSAEANLDAQYILGIARPIPMLQYSTGGRGPLVPTADQPAGPGSNEPYLEFLTFLVDQPDEELPQTLSTSYGEEEQSIPQDYALKVCNLFMQLGARGVSVLFASGDSGPGNSCVRNTDNAYYFNPTFPAGCPYVTAVGGTTGTGPEQAVSFSSGGFSIYHEQPDFQKDAVETYLTGLGDTYSEYFNRSGRGIPDVAAQGAGFAVVDKSRSVLLSGTSASTPVFAGVVALLNAARKSQGQPPLGFLNPWLYNHSAALTDITAGASSGCKGAEPFGLDGAGWNATEGWDPVTGLGTPIFDALLKAAAPDVENA